MWTFKKTVPSAKASPKPPTQPCGRQLASEERAICNSNQYQEALHWAKYITQAKTHSGSCLQAQITGSRDCSACLAPHVASLTF